jgi:hypothetical protein
MTEERNCSTILRVHRLLLFLCAAALGWAALVLVTGGIEWRIAGVLFRSREPGRALAIGLGLLILHAIVFRESFVRDSDRAMVVLRRLLPALGVCCALVLGIHAVHYGTFTAGGSDSFAYISQAYGWLNGQMPRGLPIPMSVPWPNGDASLVPLGYVPGPHPHTMVPAYAPGLPLMMAAARVVLGACGPFLVVPLCAALLVWLTFLLGRRTAGPWAGILAAMFAVTSPIVVFQSMSPMTDVPVAALWTGAALSALGGSRRSAAATGLWTAAAYLVRPNLPVIPVILFLHLAATSRGRERWIRLALFSATAAPAALAIAALYTSWHGTPFSSGFGSAEEIFSLKNIGPNLARYPVWLWQSQSPLVLLALVPFLPWFKAGTNPAARRLFAALFAGTVISYLMYFPFEEWWYLRFLLPAIPALLVLMASGLVAIGRRLPRPWDRVGVAAVAIGLILMTTRFNYGQGMFGSLKAGERRYADIGTYLRDALPANAIVLSVQHSGSVRYYGGRMTVRWDLIPRDWTPRTPVELERLGMHPYMVIEDWEMPQMRAWFGLAPDAPSPWPLVARMREPVGVSVLDMASQPAAQIVPAALAPGGAPLCAAQQPLTIQRP